MNCQAVINKADSDTGSTQWPHVRSKKEGIPKRDSTKKRLLTTCLERTSE